MGARNGTYTIAGLPHEESIPVVPWLDEETAALLRDTVATVARQQPRLRAVILHGSVARHEERPLDDDQPSDVDLLLVFDRVPGQAVDFTSEQGMDVFGSINDALIRHLEAPREVKVMLAAEDFAEWDDLFVENVAREGIVLWARGELPSRLAVCARRRWAEQPA